MGEGDKSGGEVKKLSQLERAQEKIRVAQANINRLLATEKEKQRKYDTRRKVLLGVMFQEMIAEGRIPDKLFNEFLEKYLNERDRSVFDGYLQEFSTWKPSSGSQVKTTPRPDSVDL
jgi:hypothetical protein